MQGADLREEFRAEYLLLQNMHEDYGKRAWWLKALATPVLGAGLAVGLNEPSEPILVATMVVAGALWLLEAVWKSFQYRHVARILTIEEYYRAGSFESAGPPFQIRASWQKEVLPYRSSALPWLIVLARPLVMLPYVAILLAGLISLASAPSSPGLPPDETLADARATSEILGDDGAAGTGDALTNQAGDQDGFSNTVTWRPAEKGGSGNASTWQPADDGGFGNRVSSGPEPSEPESDRGLSVPISAGLILLALGLGAMLAWALWRRRKGAAGADSTTVGAEASGSQLFTGISVCAALAAFGTALTTLSKIEGSWWLTSPILTAPLLTVLAANIGKTWRFRWFVLSFSFVVSILLICAFLIPSTVRGDASLWPGELARHVVALTAKLKPTDIVAMGGALIAYLVALAGATAAGSKPVAGKGG